MSAPEHLAGEARRIFDQAERELRQRGSWRPVHAGLVERMAVNRMEARRALETASASPTTDGSTGQLVAHPLFAVAARCDQVALSIARALQLTPATQRVAADDPDKARDEKAPEAMDELDELARRRVRAE